MARMNVVLPAMGEGIIEATINRWLVTEGSQIKEDDPLVEIATDKVDSEVPSPGTGVLISCTVAEGSIVKIGDVIAVIETGEVETAGNGELIAKEVERIRTAVRENKTELHEQQENSLQLKSRTPKGKFLSPLVRSIAAEEKISYPELDTINGTGMDGRIVRDDILAYLEKRKGTATKPQVIETKNTVAEEEAIEVEKTAIISEQDDEIIPMDRVRRLIADHMVASKRTSPHVTSFIDADVTKLVKWRNSIKDDFLARHGVKLTLTPVFIDALARTLAEFPMLNISVDGNNIIKRKNINIGMATALPDGNLIVPVIRNADEKSLTGLAKAVNDLATRARTGKLKPGEISGGTFTLTNYGTYDNIAGTPIINQPQAAILGTGAVRKMPVVLETDEGDSIAIRQIIILSLSYDHRVIDGALGGMFLKRLRDILQNYPSESF